MNTLEIFYLERCIRFFFSFRAKNQENKVGGPCLRGAALARMNVPENLVRNPQRQSAIREFKARVREETPESPSRWLPTPPVTLSSVKKQRRRVESPRPQAVRWLRL